MAKSQKTINDIQQEINLKVASHLEIANKEMGVIQEKITAIDERFDKHISWVEKTFEIWEKRWDKIDNRIWAFLITIIVGVVGFLANIYFK